jgi:hypothetical protein
VKSGLIVEGIFGTALATRISEEQVIIGYDQFGYPVHNYVDTESRTRYVSLNVKLANKWYFNQRDKWRTGLQVNWFRFGINIDPDDIFESLFLGPKVFAPLNIGCTNVVRLN